jgi:hypothetical protein
MHLIAKYAAVWFVVASGVAGLLAMGGKHARAAGPDRVEISFTRVYSGTDGLSHAEQVPAKLGAPNALGMEQSEESKAKTTNFVRFPATFFEDWHCAHARRYVITLSGRGEAEVAGGKKVAMEPGRVVLFEDFTGRGHISRALTGDWTAAFVQLE